MFDHLQGENVENYTCPVVDCPARNFFQDARVEKRCFELYKKLIIEEFCTLKFITPFITAKCTSHIEAYHASLWSQYCSKNVSHNIRSRVTEARVAASIINYNELKSGFIEFVNSLDEMKSWKISDRTGARLIRHALNNTYWSEKTRWQKKALKFKRIKNQVQYTDNVPGYKEK